MTMPTYSSGVSKLFTAFRTTRESPKSTRIKHYCYNILQRVVVPTLHELRVNPTAKGQKVKKRRPELAKIAIQCATEGREVRSRAGGVLAILLL